MQHSSEAQGSRLSTAGEPTPSNFDAYLDSPPSSCSRWPAERIPCPSCGRRGRFYCSDCVHFVGKPDGVAAPEDLRLPLQVDMIVTTQERTRSSGVHVAVVAPQSVRIVPFNQSEHGLPAYNPGSDLVVFPSKYSVCWDELSKEELATARRIVLIDSRWENTKVVLNHPNLRGLQHVRIRDPPARSRFWRWHISGDGHICTAEATYFMLKEFEAVSGVSTEGGRLEDMMFLFALVHSRIKEAYANEPAKAGQLEPSSEAAKRRRRARSIKLDKLVKAKYKGLEEVRAREGDEVAVEEFCRRRRGSSVYAGDVSDANSADHSSSRNSSGQETAVLGEADNDAIHSSRSSNLRKRPGRAGVELKTESPRAC